MMLVDCPYRFLSFCNFLPKIYSAIYKQMPKMPGLPLKYVTLCIEIK
jgi:hypothetical protein